jgi:hypothetical protein
LQALDESRAVFDRLEDQGQQVFGIVRKQRP